MCKDKNLISYVKGKGKFPTNVAIKNSQKGIPNWSTNSEIAYALNSENHRCKSVITTSRSNNHSFIHHQSLIIVVSITNY